MSMNEMPSGGEELSQSIVKAADVLPPSLAEKFIARDQKIESRRRLVEARTLLFRNERDYMADAGAEKKEYERQARSIEARAEQVIGEARAIEAEAQLQARLLLKQAEMERRLADRIRAIADRNAIAVLEKVEEVSNSIMGWAEVAANDIGKVMKEEAAEQVSRKIGDIDAVRDAMEDEERAAELLEMAARLQSRAS